MSLSSAFYLPWPPSVNHYYGRRRGGGVFIKQPGLDFRAEVMALARQQSARVLGGNPFTGRLSVEIILAPPDRRVRDIDNTQKALLDALKHAGVYRDDSQIDRLLVVRWPVERGGKARVSVSEIG